jgi:hypothetical protein
VHLSDDLTACPATVIQIRERLTHWRSAVVESSGCALLKWRLDGIIQITTYSTVLTVFVRSPLGTADVAVVTRDRSHRNMPLGNKSGRSAACPAAGGQVIRIRERLSHWRSTVVDSSGCADQAENETRLSKSSHTLYSSLCTVFVTASSRG